jgi:alpha-galactosidase
MSEPTTSGLGRNGPWLQNRWLRVETRQDDGSISPVALDGAFRPTERALAYVSPSDGGTLAFGRTDYDVQLHADSLGEGRRLTLTSHDARRGVVLRREVVVYDEHPYCVTRVGVTNERAEPLRVAAFHVFATPSEGRGRLRLQSKPPEWRVYRHGWQSWAPTLSLGGAHLDVQSAPPVLSPEPPQREPGRFASDDVGLLYDPASGRSLLAGAVTARDFISQVFVDAPAQAIDARCLADGIAVAPGETLWSERVAVDLVGHPNEQLERYGDALAREMGARAPKPAPAGWCSWYYFYTQVTEEDVVRNLRFIESHRGELPIQAVQIDDGYQADIGDWLTTNGKFPRGMAWLASEIKRAGYTPGIWTAPFLLAESSRTFAEHPDWVIRDDGGAPVVAQHNWERNNYGIDGSNPEALAWLAELFRAICDGWGYDYVKIDFLFAAAVAGRRLDERTTRIRAYRQALEAVRRGVGENRFILGCGSLMAPSVGVFDGNRIGSDTAPFWRFLTKDERAARQPRPRHPDDLLSVETAMRNTMTQFWMHNRLWANDPDCLLVRTDRTKLTLDEVRASATAIGLSGGMVLSSDDLGNVPEDRLEMISMLLPPLPRSAVPADLMESGIPERFEVAYDRPFDPVRLVAAFNFDDAVRDLSVGVPDGEWHAFDVWEEQYLGTATSTLPFPRVGEHGCKLVALRPAGNVPAVVGSTAHIGAGVLDITRQAWDGDLGELRVGLGPAGKRSRRVIVACAGREPLRVELGGRPYAFARDGDACVVEAAVDEPTELSISFAQG